MDIFGRHHSDTTVTIAMSSGKPACCPLAARRNRWGLVVQGPGSPVLALLWPPLSTRPWAGLFSLSVSSSDHIYPGNIH